MSFCACYLASGEKCINKLKPSSLYCGVHKNCKTKLIRKSPNKAPIRKEPKPCKEGQYRNPHTNRCKKNEIKLSPKTVKSKENPNRKSHEPKPCKEGQYRNPHTNRCKKIEKLNNIKLSPKQKENHIPNESPHYVDNEIVDKAKTVKNKDSLLLPDKPSILSPNEIANSIINTVNVIEGTYFCNIMVPNKNINSLLGRNAPVFILISDLHIGDQKCAKECVDKNGCYSLYNTAPFIKYINDFSKINSVSTDLFLELWFNDSARRRNNIVISSESHNSALVNVSILSNKCLSHKITGCPFPNMRTHMSDTRRVVTKIKINMDMDKAFWTADDDSKYLGDSIVTALLNVLWGDKKAIIAIKELLKEKFPDFTPNYIIRFLQKVIVSDFGELDYFNEPFVKKYSRTYHEWIQLPQSLRKQLYNRAKILYKYVYQKTHTYNDIQDINNYFNMIVDTSKYVETSYKIKSLYLLHVKIFLVDMYTISRSLKTFKGGLPSQLSVIYLGGAHIENITYLLGDLYTSVQTYGKPIDTNNLTIEIVKNIDKCAVKQR